MMADETKKNAQDGIQTTNGFTKEIIASIHKWPDHITSVDLSNQNLSNIDENVEFPPNLIELNLTQNRLAEIPSAVLELKELKRLDVSHNKLKYFNESPKFCHTIEVLNLSHNCLLGPPLWVWKDFPSQLYNLDLSYNLNLKDSLQNDHLKELLQYKTSVTNLKINNCCLRNELKIMNTFPKLQVLDLGSEMLTNISLNKVIEIPFKETENSCDIKSLNLSNTCLYNVKNNIDIFNCLVEINLSQNYISGLPHEFCNLKNLEVCILSFNSILYLPDDLGKLRKLIKLCVDSNELCMLPDSVVELTNLKCLDVYNNCLYEIPEMKRVIEIDLAQNYFEEPLDSEYISKKRKLRSGVLERFDGRKPEAMIPDSEHSPDTSDDESYLRSISRNSNSEAQKYDVPSSPEDWDSDDYWVPRFCTHSPQTPRAKWLCFVEKKMQEGNFCPMDAHIVSVAEKVSYEKMCNPITEHESDGQFDDFSGDDS